jgi:hypothetical protein
MRYQNLRKNDVLFCESKGSRVLKLVEKIDGSWVGRDVFTNQNFQLNNTDQFKLVNRERKVKPLSLVSLVESTNGPSTLTEKEVFIVDYIMDNYDPDELKDFKESYDNFTHMDTKISHFSSLLRYLNLPGGHTESSFFQYILCAYENMGKTITTSTPITRLFPYECRWTEERLQTEYTTYTIDFYASNDELADKISEDLRINFWEHDPQAEDSDYGDSQFVGMVEPGFQRTNMKPFVID